MQLSINLDIDVDDLANEIVQNNDLDKIHYLIIKLDELMENEEFTTYLIKDLMYQLEINEGMVDNIMNVIELDKS